MFIFIHIQLQIWAPRNKNIADKVMIECELTVTTATFPKNQSDRHSYYYTQYQETVFTPLPPQSCITHTVKKCKIHYAVLQHTTAQFSKYAQ